MRATLLGCRIALLFGLAFYLAAMIIGSLVESAGEAAYVIALLSGLLIGVAALGCVVTQLCSLILKRRVRHG